MTRSAGFALAVVATSVIVVTWDAGPGWKGVCLAASSFYPVGFLAYVLVTILDSEPRATSSPKGDPVSHLGVLDR